MAIDFPASPSVNDTFIVGGVTYTWDGTKWTAVAVAGAIDAITEGNSKAEVIDTGSDGRFVVTTEGVERFRVASAGQIGLAGANYGTSGQVLTSGGTGAAPTWSTPAGGDSITEGNTSAEVIDTGSDGRFVITTEGTERARVDSSGRLLVGTSTARDKFNNAASGQDPLVQFESAGTAAKSLYMLSLTANNASIDSNAGVSLMLARSNGTSLNSYTLVPNGNCIGKIRFQAADGSEFVEAAEISAFVDGTSGANDMPGRLVFSTTADNASSPTERMRIRENGKVWIGTTSDIRLNREQFVVKATNAEGILVQTNGLSYSGYSYKDADSGAGTHYIGYWENSSGTNVGAITHNNTSTSYVTSSDYRLKENVVDLEGAIDRLKQLPVHRFNFIADPDHIVVDGFIAHEAAEVVAECVTGEKDAVDDDGNPVYQGIDQSKLVPLLTAALQEAVARIEQLEAKVAALQQS